MVLQKLRDRLTGVMAIFILGLLAVPFAQAVHIAATYTPGLAPVLGLSPIPLSTWTMLAGVALGLLVVEELHKAWLRRAGPGPRARTAA